MSGHTFWDMYTNSPAASWLPGDGSAEAIRAAHEADRHKFHAVVSPYGFFREAVLLAALDEMAVKHEARVSELLAANNAEVDRRRAAEAAFSWQPIETLPPDPPVASPEAIANEALVLAKTADGRRMIWRSTFLRGAMRDDTPEHLQFPAIAWMPLPE